MNEQTALALKIAVERTVRPVRASIGRKLKMREELLGHLTARSEEEYGRLHDEAAAAGEAITRFGAAADLSQELQQTVPRTERFWNTVDPCRSVGWNIRHVYRGIILLEMAFLVLFFAVVGFFSPTFAFQPDLARLVAWLPSLLVLDVLFGLMLTAGLCGHLLVCGSVYGLFGLRRSVGRAVGAGLAMIVLMTAAMGMLLPCKLAFSSPGLALASWLTPPLLKVTILYLLTPWALFSAGTILVAAILEGRPLRRTLPWRQLELD